MTELEKCHAGLLYDACVPEIVEANTRCMGLCNEYNALAADDLEGRDRCLRGILAEAGRNLRIEQGLRVSFGSYLRVGDDFYANYDCVFLDNTFITFGDRVFIGPQCGFYTAHHPIDAKARSAGLEYAFPIRVGSDVWFGGSCVVLPGVTIGSDVVIGAGSVVTHDIPDHVVAAGNPCRVLRPITDADRI